MISRALKENYYRLFKYPLKISGAFYRGVLAPAQGTVKVHLGPGQSNYLTGWYNVDANFVTARVDVWADLRNKLPFRDNTVDAFYSHHVIEHLPDLEIPAHFQDMYRCLKPGGVLRVGGPHADNAFRKYLEGDAAWFFDFPDKRSSMGGRLSNFILCRNEHLALLTESFLREVAANAGFTDITPRNPCSDTGFPQIFDGQVLGKEWEPTPATPHTILIEARKPQ